MSTVIGSIAAKSRASGVSSRIAVATSSPATSSIRTELRSRLFEPEAAGAIGAPAVGVAETGPDTPCVGWRPGEVASKPTSAAASKTMVPCRRARWRMVVFMPARKADPEAARKFLLRGVLTGHPNRRACGVP
jgi:hypothetical protein